MPAVEILHAKPFGLIDGHRVGGCRGLKPDAEEDDLPVRVLARDRQCVQRRVHDPHVRATALDLVAGRFAAGDAQHVPEEQKMTPGRDAISRAFSITSSGLRRPGNRESSFDRVGRS